MLRDPELVAAIAGVVLGFGLSELGSWWRERLRARRKARGVRAVLRVEIAKNREQLRRMLDSGGPLPTQSNHVWESQLASAPEALTESEIRQIHGFYYDLYGLKKVGQAELRAAVAEFVDKPPPLGE